MSSRFDNLLDIDYSQRNPQGTYMYPVSSMDVHTYSRSRKYLAKYRALSMIETIVKVDSGLSVEHRTPKWLVDQYLRTNREHFERTRSSSSHTPRHIHRSEVYAVFGRHASWLSETIKKKRGNLLNEEAWTGFWDEVRSRRKGMESDEDELQDLDELERNWGAPKGPDSTSPEGQMDVDPEDTDELEYVSTHSSDIPIEVSVVLPYCSLLELILASQGTKSRSISPEPDYPLLYTGLSKDIDRKKHVPGDPEVLSAIPKPFFCDQPILQRNMTWFCPDLACSYSLDFLHLPDEVLDELDYSSRSYLCSHNWKVSDDDFLELFYDIVEQHYFKHLEDSGIKVVGYGSEEFDIFNQPISQERRITKPRELRTDDHVRC